MQARRCYWMSVQHVVNWYDYGQWLWQQTDGEHEYPTVMDFDEADVARWTPLADLLTFSDLAFQLSVYDSPAEQTSWGTIKAMYR